MGSRPGRIPELLHQAILKRQQPILRSFCSVPEVWHRRLRQLDLRGSTFLALQMDAWLPYTASFQSSSGISRTKEEDSLIVKLALRDYARRLQRTIERLRQENLLSLDPEAFLEAERAKIPRWQFIAHRFFPKFLDAWPRAARLELSADLTTLVFEERQRRAEGLDWVYETIPKGLTLRLDGDLAFPVPKALPARFDFPPEEADSC